MPPLPDSAASRATATPHVCAVCGDPLEPEDRFCGHCGHDVTAPAPERAGPGPGGTARAGADTAGAERAGAAQAAAGPDTATGAATVHGEPGAGAAGQSGPAQATPEPGEPARAEPAQAGTGRPPAPPRDGTDPHARTDPQSRDAPPGPGADAAPGERPAAGAPAPATPARPADHGGHAFADADADDGSGTGTGTGEESDPTLVLGMHARASDPREEPEPAPGPAGDTPAADAVCVACGVGGVDADGYCERCGHAQPRQRDHQEKELEGVAAVSDRGLRHHRNEDAFTVAAASLPDGTPAVSAVVCDGVSTAYRPDDASAVAAATGSDALLGALERGASAGEAMHGALMAAFDAVTALAAEDPAPDASAHRNAPACTYVSAVVIGPVFTVGWIGDSRAYWVPDDREQPAVRLTEDDSWAARMVAAGLMSHADAYADARAHAITGWLGADAIDVDPHVAAFEPQGPGVIVVCTDGLWNYAESAAEMAAAVPGDAHARPLHGARALVGLALDGGGHDNVTVAVLPFPAAVSRAPVGPAARTAASPN